MKELDTMQTTMGRKFKRARQNKGRGKNKTVKIGRGKQRKSRSLEENIKEGRIRSSYMQANRPLKSRVHDV